MSSIPAYNADQDPLISIRDADLDPELEAARAKKEQREQFKLIEQEERKRQDTINEANAKRRLKLLSVDESGTASATVHITSQSFLNHDSLSEHWNDEMSAVLKAENKRLAEENSDLKHENENLTIEIKKARVAVAGKNRLVSTLKTISNTPHKQPPTGASTVLTAAQPRRQGMIDLAESAEAQLTRVIGKAVHREMSIEHIAKLDGKVASMEERIARMANIDKNEDNGAQQGIQVAKLESHVSLMKSGVAKLQTLLSVLELGDCSKEAIIDQLSQLEEIMGSLRATITEVVTSHHTHCPHP